MLAPALLLTVPASAAAAQFGELPFRAAGDMATCLRATGAPGELVRRSSAGAQLFAAGPAGLTAVAAPAVEGDTGCPDAAASAPGGGVVAFPVLQEAIGVEAVEVIRAATRDPGGAWGPVADALPAPGLLPGKSLATAASDAGHALVAIARRAAAGRLEIRVARRTPGVPFGAAETIFGGRSGAAREVSVRAGMSAAGEAVVAWSYGPRRNGPRELWAAVAAPGAAFGAPVRIGETRLGSPFALAVGPGGHALLAFASGTELRVAERAPGAGFGAAVAVARADDDIAIVPGAAVGAGGGAIVAWQQALDLGVRAVVRAGPGAFGPPVRLARPVRLGLAPDVRWLLVAITRDEDGEYGTGTLGPDSEAANPRAVITADGRALLTWAAPAKRAGVWWNAPHSATLALAGGAAEVRRHGAQLRDVGSLTPLLLEGGAAAVAWTDNDEASDGRIHLALEGAAQSAAPAPPRVRIRPPSKRVLDPDDSLDLRVTCSAACDVRAHAGAARLGANGALSLRRAGSGNLRLDSAILPLAGARARPVRLRVSYGAPGTPRAASRTLTLNLRRRPGPQPPRVLDAVARRAGDDVVVTWRTDRNAKTDRFLVVTPDASPSAGRLVLPRGGPRRFRARLRAVRGARTVSIFVSGDDMASFRPTRVRIRG